MKQLHTFFDDVVSDFYILSEPKKIMLPLLSIGLGKTEIKQCNYKISKIMDKSIYHINSGGNAFIFRISKDYCIRINQFYNVNNESIPVDLYKNLDAPTKRFLNHSVRVYEEKILITLFQIYIETFIIFKIIEHKNSKKNLTFHDLNSILKESLSKEPIDLYNRLFKGNNNKNNTRMFYNIIFTIYNNTNIKPIIILNKYPAFYNLFERTFFTVNLKTFIFWRSNPSNKLEHYINLYNKYNNIEDLNYILNIDKKYSLLINNIYIEKLAYGNLFEALTDEKNNLLDNNLYKEDNKKVFRILHSEKNIKLCFLQIFIFMVQAYVKCKFIHNDLRPENILVFASKPFTYKFENVIFRFKDNLIFKVNDFDFSITQNISNSIIKKYKISRIKNIFGDIHYFFISFFRNYYLLKQYINIYHEIYNKIIKFGKCKLCDENYIRFNKTETYLFRDHRSYEKIDPILISEFIKTSELFNNWRINKCL